MDNKQLLYFLAIAEEGSISKAAKKLFIAQPYLSQQLKQLESELGVKLVERTTRRFQVTEAGKVLSYRARQMTELSEATVKELRDLSAGVRGTLYIGCVSSALETILMQKIYIFHAKYKDIDYEIHQNSTCEILELLKRGIIEIGVIRGPVNPEIFESISLPEEPMAALATSRPGFGCGGSDLALEEVASEPLLVQRKFAEEIADSFRLRGLEPRILCRIDDARPLLSLAERGIGVAVVPRDWSRLIPGSALRCFEIPELRIKSRVVIAWPKNHYLTAAARHFLECFEKE